MGVEGQKRLGSEAGPVWALPRARGSQGLAGTSERPQGCGCLGGGSLLQVCRNSGADERSLVG